MNSSSEVVYIRTNRGIVRTYNLSNVKVSIIVNGCKSVGLFKFYNLEQMSKDLVRILVNQKVFNIYFGILETNFGFNIIARLLET